MGAINRRSFRLSERTGGEGEEEEVLTRSSDKLYQRDIDDCDLYVNHGHVFLHFLHSRFLEEESKPPSSFSFALLGGVSI